MRTIIRGLGEVMITLGLVLLLFVGYQLWWTNIVAHQSAQRVTGEVISQWQAAPPPSGPAPAELVDEPADGVPFALITIPRLGDSVSNAPVVQGVSLDILAEGFGHYPGTAMPGQVGNFATAAHRATHGEPLRDVDQLQAGDNVYVQTQDYWYTYRLFRDQIVDPDAIWVVGARPFPDDPNVPDRLITLTTCNPRWASTERWAWWGYLAARQPKSAPPPAMVVNG